MNAKTPDATSDIRAVLANDSFPPLIDGVANAVLNYARTITKKYGFAAVATPKYPGTHDDYPFPVLRYPSVNTVRMLGYRTGNPFDIIAMQRLSAFRPDIIHSHCPLASTYLSRELRSVTGAPIVFTYHTKFDIDINRALKSGVLKEAAIRVIVENIEACDEVWVVNRGAGENLCSLGYKGKYRLMPNGVDFPRGCAPQEDIDSLDDTYGLSHDVPLFLFVGRMMWYKGQRIIIDGLRRLKAEKVGFRMVFVGDGDNLGDIKAYARECGLGDDCIFTGAIRDRALLRAWYSRADLFLLPSVFDNNPIVVKEAAACGTASVLVRDSSSAEGVRDGVSGILIGENASDMARALMTVCRTPGLSARLGEEAQKSLYASWEDMIDVAVSRYREVIAASLDGALPPHRAPSDRAIDMVGDIQDGIDRLRDFFARAGDIL